MFSARGARGNERVMTASPQSPGTATGPTMPTVRAWQLRARPPVANQDQGVAETNNAIVVEVGGTVFAAGCAAYSDSARRRSSTSFMR